jgi:hypothetical protein
MIERKPIPADLVDRLTQAKHLKELLPNFFPSDHSLRHFLRTRRSILIERGLLIETPGTLLIDAPRLREQLIEIMQLPAPDLPVRGVTRKPAATAPAE